MEKFYCEACKKYTTSHIDEVTRDFVIKGEKITVSGAQRVCDICGEVSYDLYLDQDIAEKAIIEYNSLYGIDTFKIIEMRKKYKISQTTLSKIIGIAKKTLVSYETNQAIPNDHYTQLLRAIIHDNSMLYSLAKESKENFTEKELQKIDSLPRSIIMETDEFTGYTKLNFRKYVNAILYITQKAIGKTKIYKTLFYTDFNFYRTNHQSMTGSEYLCFLYGPVPKEGDEIINALVDSKMIAENHFEVDGKVCTSFLALQVPDMTCFSQREKELLKMVLSYVTSLDYITISNGTHEENAWLLSENFESISYEHANTLKNIF